MRIVRVAYRLCLVALHLSWAAVMTRFLLSANPERRSRRDWGLIMDWMQRLCEILGMRIHVSGTPADGPVLLAANHISWHDIVVLQSQIATGFVAKYEIRGWPLIGWLAHRGNTLFIRRGQRESAQQIKQAMQPRFADRQNIMVFPEGTTGTGETVLRFRSRLFEAATEMQIPIQPVAIYYRIPGKSCKDLAFIGDESFFAHMLRTLAEPRIDAHVHFCPAIDSCDVTHRRELGQQAQQQVAEALNRLQQNESLSGGL